MSLPVVLQLVKKAAAQSGQRHPDTTDMFWNASEMASDFPDDISQLKLWFHGKMAPRVKAPVNDPKAPMSTRISTTRSEFRINFCRAISTNAESIVQLLKDNQKWKDIFPSDTVSQQFHIC